MKKLWAFCLFLTVLLGLLGAAAQAEEDRPESSVVFPANLTVIEEGAFESDTSLSVILIPETVERIEARAFANCTGLREVYFGSGEKLSIARDAFSGCSDLCFYVFPETLPEQYALAHGFDCGLLEAGSSFLERALKMIGAMGGTDRELLSADFATQRLIVCMDDSTLPDIAEYHPIAIAKDKDNIFFISFESVADTIDCCFYLRGQPDVVFVEADANLRVLNEVSAAGYVSPYLWGTDDPLGFDAYSAFVKDNAVRSVTIAVIDSGVAEHAYYSDNLVQGKNMLSDGQSWSYDPVEHGSKVASIIRSCVGEADVRILPVRVVSDNGFVDIAELAEAIEYAANLGADVINLSLTPLDTSSYVTRQIRRALSRGISVVVSAGDSSRDIVKVYPAQIEGVTAVSGINESYTLSDSSNYGGNVTYTAPDTGLENALFDSIAVSTDFSAPIISSMLALVTMDPYHTLNDVANTCLDLGAEGRDSAYGYGLPQLHSLAQVFVQSIEPQTELPELLAVGESFRLQWRVLPESATDRTVTLSSSDESVLCIEADGEGGALVTAVAPGSADVTVRANGTQENTSASFSFFVECVQPVSSIHVVGLKPSIYTNQLLTLSTEVLPKNATNRQITWVSTNEEVAEVTEDGIVIPLAAGTTGIYAVAEDGYGASSALAALEVIQVPDAESIVLSEASGLDISGDTVFVNLEQTLQLKATVLPENARQLVTWGCRSTPRNAITIDSNGLVTVADDGRAVVVATTLDGLQARLTIETVVYPTRISVESHQGNRELDVGQTLQLSAVIIPSNSTDKEISWICSKPEVATVDRNGLVTGISPGVVTVIATSKQTPEISGSIMLTVKKPFTLHFDPNGGSLDVTSRQAYCGYTLRSAIGALPEPQRDFYTFQGWFTDPSDGSRVSSSSTLEPEGDVTVYAHWRLNSLSRWVSESSVPEDAQIVNRRTETRESTSAAISGFTAVDSYWRQTYQWSIQYCTKPDGVRGTWVDNNFEDGPREPYNNGYTKREVDNKWAGYIYWHWMYDTNYANGWERRMINNGPGRAGIHGYNFIYFGAFQDSTDYTYGGTGYSCSKGLPNFIVPHKTAWSECQGATRWFRFDYFTSTYTDYELVHKFQRELVQYRKK